MRKLEAAGWLVLRFWEHEVVSEVERVVERVEKVVRETSLPVGILAWDFCIAVDRERKMVRDSTEGSIHGDRWPRAGETRSMATGTATCAWSRDEPRRPQVDRTAVHTGEQVHGVHPTTGGARRLEGEAGGGPGRLDGCMVWQWTRRAVYVADTYGRRVQMFVPVSP